MCFLLPNEVRSSLENSCLAFPSNEMCKRRSIRILNAYYLLSLRVIVEHFMVFVFTSDIKSASWLFTRYHFLITFLKRLFLRYFTSELPLCV